MKLHNYPVLLVLLPFSIGIGTAYFSSLSFSTTHLICILCFLWITASLFHALSKYKTQWISSIFIQLLFLIAGFQLTNFRFQNNISATEEKLLENNKYWIAKIVEHPIEKEKTYKVVAEIQQDLNEHDFRHKIVLYLGKNDLVRPQYGNLLIFNAKLSEIENNSNPYSFDYKSFMARKSIFYSAYVPLKQWQIIGDFAVNPVIDCSYKIQQHLSQIFAEAGMSGDEYGIITAILLGNDDTMNPELKQSYAAAGVSHILCVSGMHVGIIFMILDFLLQPLEINPKTKILKTVILMLFIWIYACITGLSPSVTRAASMFSFVSIGSLLRRNTNIFHSLFASLFILLVINPLLLFELGFQLSYLAVFGIVIFQGKIVALWTPKGKILQYFWNLISVSIAAQLTTFPLSIYYFGQFPNYFLLANMSVIALSFIVVVSGVILLAFSFIPTISNIVTWILTHEIKLMNFIICSIESLPGAVTRNISISWIQMLLFYGIIIAFFLLFQQRKKIYYWCGISAFAIIILLFDIDKYQTQHIENYTIYNIGKGTAVSFNYHGKTVIFSDSIRDKSHPNYHFAIENQERKERFESIIIPFDSVFYQNEFLVKQGDWVYMNGKSYYLAHSKKYFYATSDKFHVDYFLLLNPYLSTKYISSTFQCKYLVEH